MRQSVGFRLFIGLLIFNIYGCGDVETLPQQAGFGPHPTLPPPNLTLIPTINIAAGKGWPTDVKPKVAAGLSVNAFARGLSHPRWLYVLPNGDVLVAETNAPKQADTTNTIKDWFVKWGMKRAGAGSSSANRITLLRDVNGDGVAELQTIFLQDLNSPFGMALVHDQFYVANTDSLMRFPYRTGETQIREAGTKVLDLPAGSINYHWTKNILANSNGSRLYVTVGSNSNIGENGLENEVNRAAILEVDPSTGHFRVFASGLRNPNGLAWQPQTGVLWTTVNERDELGNDLVPDYLTSVKDGGFYGWPASYYGQHIDSRVDSPQPDLVAKAIVPDYALGAHTASLGLVFNTGKLFPKHFLNGAFIGQHGSWNREPRSGYKVIFVPFADGQPIGMPEDILAGFISPDGDAYGRPVGVTLDNSGALLVADDVGNTIWRVTPTLAK